VTGASSTYEPTTIYSSTKKFLTIIPDSANSSPPDKETFAVVLVPVNSKKMGFPVFKDDEFYMQFVVNGTPHFVNYSVTNKTCLFWNLKENTKTLFKANIEMSTSNAVYLKFSVYKALGEDAGKFFTDNWFRTDNVIISMNAQAPCKWDDDGEDKEWSSLDFWGLHDVIDDPLPDPVMGPWFCGENMPQCSEGLKCEQCDLCTGVPPPYFGDLWCGGNVNYNDGIPRPPPTPSDDDGGNNGSKNMWSKAKPFIIAGVVLLIIMIIASVWRSTSKSKAEIAMARLQMTRLNKE
jgi:hypothetical protein